MGMVDNEKSALQRVREATRAALQQPTPSPEALEPLVQELEAPDRLAWALQTVPPLGRWAATVGAQAASESKLTLLELIERCRYAPNGPAVLLARSLTCSISDMRRILREAGEMAVELLRLSFHETSAEALWFVTAAIEVVPQQLLLRNTLGAELARVPPSAVTHLFVEHISSYLLRVIVTGALAPRDVAGWLRLRLLQEKIAKAAPSTLFDGYNVRSSGPRCLPNLMQAIAASLTGESSTRVFWIPNLIELPLKEANAEGLADSAADLTILLHLSWTPEERLRLAVAILDAVRRTGCRKGQTLVELTFSEVYTRLVQDRIPPSWRSFVFFADSAWKLAKEWRSWLVDSWIIWSWQPVALLRCLAGDHLLFRQLAHRAAQSRDGLAFLHALRDALAADAELSAKWSDAVTEVLENPHTSIDTD
jgi:hypothetical protein